MLAVDGELFADRANLVGKGNLQCMESIAGIFENFGFLKFEFDDGGIDLHFLPDFSQGAVRKTLLPADDDVGRRAKIANGAAFTKELWVKVDFKARTSA